MKNIVFGALLFGCVSAPVFFVGGATKPVMMVGVITSRFCGAIVRYERWYRLFKLIES